jgi:hypothetical protein
MIIGLLFLGKFQILFLCQEKWEKISIQWDGKKPQNSSAVSIHVYLLIIPLHNNIGKLSNIGTELSKIVQYEKGVQKCVNAL